MQTTPTITETTDHIELRSGTGNLLATATRLADGTWTVHERRARRGITGLTQDEALATLREWAGTTAACLGGEIRNDGSLRPIR